MSNYETKPGSFSLFKNENRTDENNQPHYNGNGKDMNGNDFQVSAWVATSKAGLTYFSCKMKEPYKKDEPSKGDLEIATKTQLEPDLPF
jgi:uncharacterized protein (DUF736 family)|tara:strand:- start:34 stop:300 length:267 start_codon:yes stop_codon:yes gene_type:complete